MAYFDKEVSLSEMVRHIYGNCNVITYANRPNLFVKELKMYIDYLKNEISQNTTDLNAGQVKKWNAFKNNILDGIAYYENLLETTSNFEKLKNDICNQLQCYKKIISETRMLVLTSEFTQ